METVAKRSFYFFSITALFPFLLNADSNSALVLINETYSAMSRSFIRIITPSKAPMDACVRARKDNTSLLLSRRKLPPTTDDRNTYG